MIQLPYLSIAGISGRDAGQFLHAQMSADIAVLNDAEATFSCYCNPRGQVVGTLLIARSGEEYLAVANGGLMLAIAQRLKRYVLRDDVSIEILEDVAVWGLSGSERPPSGFTELAPVGSNLRYAAGPAAKIDEKDQIGVWKYVEILNGIAWLDETTTESFLPQMLGLDKSGAVSFSKGCYPGQEIIARTKYLGKLKRFPAILVLTSNPGLASGEKVGLVQGGSQAEAVIIDHATAPAGKTVLLAVARHDPELRIDRLIAGGREVAVA